MSLKNSMLNIAKYVGLGIAGGLSIFNVTKAQSNPNNYKPLNEIVTEGDNIIIPSEKYNEFLKNYKPEKTQKLQKITDATKDGYITSALTAEPLQGIELTFPVSDFSTFSDTLGPIYTNNQGYYTLIITRVENEQEINNIGIIKYNIMNTPSIELDLKKLSNVEIKLYNLLGQEIKTLLNEETNNKIIDADINNLASGVYILQTTIDGKPYNNKILKTDEGYNYGKSIDKITEENKKKNLEKTTTEIYLGRWMKDPNNQYHEYQHPEAEPYAQSISKDFTLIPRINLEEQITDPEYNVIPTIRTLRDLLWYTARVQGEWNNLTYGYTLFPIQLFIDENNASIGGALDARSVIQYFQDSLDIHPDSLIKESPTDITPDFNNGFSSAKIIWTDSIGTEGYNSIMDVIFSSSNSRFIGARIYIDTNKVAGEDIGKYIAINLQKYITGGPNPINNPNYLGYTTPNRIGTTKRPNNDEKKLIKTGRNSKPYYINRVYP